MIGILVKIIDIYSLLIVISTIGSWFNFRNNKYFKYAEILFNYIDKLTEPYLKLFKILMPVGAGSIDISPIIGLTLLNFVKRILVGMVFY